MTADTFAAVVWNIYHGTEPQDLLPHARREHELRGVSLFLLNEAQKRPGLKEMLRSLGLRSFFHGQHCLVWDPKVLCDVRLWGERLTETPFFTPSGHEMHSDAAQGIFCDMEGRTLFVSTYHTPSAVQSQRNERRIQVTLESFVHLAEQADDSLCDGVLFGGDDNVDEHKGWSLPKEKEILLGAATGLRQLRAPGPTYGNRKIDDFRIIRPRDGGGIRAVKDKAWVAHGGQAENPAHRIHGREFRWVK